MLLRFSALSLIVMAGAAILVAPSPSDRPIPKPTEAVGSAIALLGDVWDQGAPETIAPEAEPIRAPVAVALPPPTSPEPSKPARAVPDHLSDLRAPLRRPSDLTGPSQPVAAPAPREVAEARPAEAASRWVVRDRTTGAVLAEVPLNEALALLQARSLH